MRALITQIYNTKDIKLSMNYYGRKICSLIKAYGVNYPFCRLYKTDGGYLLIYNSSMIIDVIGENTDEVSEFIKLIKPVSVESENSIGLNIKDGYIKTNRTLFQGIPNNNNVNIEKVKINTDLNRVYSLLCEGFGLKDYESWYADISHRIRHGVTRVFLYNSTTVTEQFDIDGFVFLSHIATGKSGRGKGSARSLLYYLSREYSINGKTMYLFSLDERESFYREIGFIPVNSGYLYELNI